MTQKIQKITTSEAAKILDISKTRVLQLIHLQILSAERVGRQFVLRKPDVLAARGRKAGRPKKNRDNLEIKQPVTTIKISANSPTKLVQKSSNPMLLWKLPKPLRKS